MPIPEIPRRYNSHAIEPLIPHVTRITGAVRSSAGSLHRSESFDPLDLYRLIFVANIENRRRLGIAVARYVTKIIRNREPDPIPAFLDFELHTVDGVTPRELSPFFVVRFDPH
jgi:hypothetical protein